MNTMYYSTTRSHIIWNLERKREKINQRCAMIFDDLLLPFFFFKDNLNVGAI